jgi:hypothetical protein
MSFDVKTFNLFMEQFQKIEHFLKINRPNQPKIK